MFDGDPNLLGQKFGSPLKKFGGPKTAKFGPSFRKLRNFISKQDIVERKTALQTAISYAHAQFIWWT